MIRCAAEENQPSITVDLLLDGSASQNRQQEKLATQACLIAESLSRCRIPVRVTAFCSVSGCTVLRVLRELADRKTTMIIVTHEMHFARDVADRILFMDGGVVVEEGPAKQLIDHPREQRTKQFLAHYAE